MGRTDSTLSSNDDDLSPNESESKEIGVKQDSLDVDALVTTLVERLTPHIERIAQSQKDRRFNKFEKEFSTLRAQLKEGLVSEGMEPEEADEEISRQLARKIPPAQPKKAAPSSETAAPGTSAPLADAQRLLLDKLGLKEEDPDVIALNQRQYASEALRMADLAALAVQRASPPPPTGAVVPSGTMARVDLEREYRAEMLAARGKGASMGRGIREKYRNLGLNIDAVKF